MTPPAADVVLAVVVGPRGVLLIERIDRAPLLAFPGGKIEPAETVHDAAAREVLEETGVRVVCGETIAERVHPDTGAAITYVAAAPVGEGDPSPHLREVAATAWWPLSQALDRLSGVLHPAVHAHLSAAA